MRIYRVDGLCLQQISTPAHKLGTARQVVSDDKQLTFLLDNKGQVNPWKYQLPQLRLTSRTSINSIQSPEANGRLTLSANGEIAGL